MSSPSVPAAGWYPDPSGGLFQRWWDGSDWSTHTIPLADAAARPVPHAPALPAAPAYPASPAAPPAYGTPQPAYGTPAHAAVVPYGSPQPVQPYGAYGWRPVTPKPFVTGMGSAVKAVFANYATFEGRAGRPEYWYWYLFNVLVVTGAVLLIWVPGVNILLAFALIAWGLTIFIPSLAVTVRRLRDAGLPWGLIFITLVPNVGSIVLIILCAQRSKLP